MKGNNFKQLLEEEEQNMTPPPPEIEDKLAHNISFLDFFGKTVELYLPKIFEIFIVMLGGTVKEIKEADTPVIDKGQADGDYDETPGDAQITTDPNN